MPEDCMIVLGLLDLGQRGTWDKTEKIEAVDLTFVDQMATNDKILATRYNCCKYLGQSGRRLYKLAELAAMMANLVPILEQVFTKICAIVQSRQQNGKSHYERWSHIKDQQLTFLPLQQWNRLVRFIAEDDDHEHVGEPIGSEVDIGAALASSTPVHILKFNGSTPLDPAIQPTTTILTARSLLPPLSREEVGTIRCIGLNYRHHAAEMKLVLPTHPCVFFKPASRLNSPDAPLRIPYQATDSQADYEAELAVVIGQDCRNVEPRDALSYVLGYMCSNDVTARKWQFAGGNTQWGYGKGFDGFAPMGPCLVPARAIPDPNETVLKTFLNGEVMQKGKADDMIFSIAEIM